jgi:hypothetical protein
MPTLKLSNSQKPGLPQIKRFIMMLLRRGDLDRAQLVALMQSNPQFRPALVAQAVADLKAEGKIEEE